MTLGRYDTGSKTKRPAAGTMISSGPFMIYFNYFALLEDVFST